MLNNFLNKMLLITSILTLGSILFKKNLFQQNKYKKEFLGFFGGTIGILFFAYPDLIHDNALYIGTLWIILSATSLFGNFSSSLIAGLMLLCFDLIYFMSLDITIISLLFILICGIADILPIRQKYKWLVLNSSWFLIFLSYSKSLSIPVYPFLMICITASSYVLLLLYLIRKNYISYMNLKIQATKDYLTGLNNKRQFNLILKKTFSNLGKKDKLALIMIDIDYFKYINDTYGHPTGDKILKQFTEVLKKLCPTNNISRLGGEEFGILLSNYSLSKTYDLAEKIRSGIQESPFKIDEENTINITVSIGISVYPDTAEDISSLIKTADQALYKAKKFGRNRVNLPLKIYNIKEPAS